ncbi:MAG: pyridoxal-phosphate dependent enzyme [Planctomycetota bacterium]
MSTDVNYINRAPSAGRRETLLQDADSPPYGRFAILHADVEAAARRIAEDTIVTPTVDSEALRRRVGADVTLKAECLQRTGSFKARGAANAVLSISEQGDDRGVFTHSSGNHAAALARAAASRDISCRIVMPENAIAKKIANVRACGIEPEFCGPTTEERLAAAGRVERETGFRMIPPYDDPLVMAGQGTVGIEILRQVPDVDVIVVPVGGGGLLSGILVAVKSVRPDVRVIAAEPALADDAARSLEAGSIQRPTRYDTVADGLRTALGTRTFPVILALVDGIELVAEAEILESTAWIAADTDILSEPSGAVALAAVYRRREEFAGKKVVAVVSGGNFND